MSSANEEIRQEKNHFGFSICHYSSDGKGVSVKHWQRNNEICQIYAGEYEFVVGAQRFTAHQGDIVVIPAGELHQLGGRSALAGIRICLFHEGLLCGLVKELHQIQTHITLRQMQQLNAAEEICSVMDEIYNEDQQKKPEYKGLIQSGLIRLCCLLLRHFKTEQPKKKQDMSLLALMQSVCEYIAQNYKSDISLQDLSRATNYSSSYISTQFADIAGVTVKEYLETYRINKVISCITETGCSYSDAASRCGFNTIRTFNNAFKRVTGTTPSDFFGGCD